MARWIRISATLDAVGRLAIGASCLVLISTATPEAAIAADKLVLQLHREPRFEFAGYYAALWKGFYQTAGLEVEIKPGAPTGAAPIDPVREVAERRAQFGTGNSHLLINTAQGLPLLLLAPIFQQSGAAVYYRSDSDFSSPRALLSAKLGRLPPSNILDLELRTAFHSEGIDVDKVKSVSLEPGQALAALTDRLADAVVGSAWELPWQARERSVALKSFALAEYRPEFYGDGLFTLQRFANADPGIAQRFREASLKGWEYALQHPDEIAARIVAELPTQVSDPAGFARYQSELARKLARFPDVPLGQANLERWSGIQQSLIAVGAISRPTAIKSFLYDPDALTRGFTNRLVLLTLSAAVVFAGFVIVGRRWQRRSPSGPVLAEDLEPAVMRKPISALPDQARLFTLVQPGLAKLRALAQDGLQQARKITRQLAIQRSSARPAACTTDLNATLAALDRSIRRRLPNAVKCRLSLLPEPQLLCHADPDAVNATILDLVGEAVSAMPSGGELVVGTRQCTIDYAAAAEFPGSAPGEYLRVTVKDNGSGLSSERLERIFYPETTSRPAIAAAWRMTHRLGGFAAVESAEGVGTAVHLYFHRVFETGVSVEHPGEEYMQAQAAE